MPLPMVHLAIAVEMHQDTEQAVSPNFLLGSLAPDAIHIRPDTTRADKNKTHLLDKSDPTNYNAIRALLDCYWGTKDQDFAQGYAAHVLTDRIWLEHIVKPLRAALPSDISQDEIARLYYRDTDQIDLNLYCHQPWRPTVWSQLSQSDPIDFAGLLTASEIAQWRDRTLNLFKSLTPDTMIEPIHITDAMVQDFIPHAAREINRLFQIWNTRLVH